MAEPVNDSPEGPWCPETSDGDHTLSYCEGGKCMACGQLGPQDWGEEDPY